MSTRTSKREELNPVVVAGSARRLSPATSARASGILTSTLPARVDGAGAVTPPRSDAVGLLRVFAVVVMILPGDIAIKAAGAAAFPGGLVGLFAFVAWIAATLLGQRQQPIRITPVHVGVIALWTTTFISFFLMHLHSRPGVEVRGGDRWLEQLAMWTGVIVVAAELLPTLADVNRVLRALVWGGAVCGTVAVLQYAFRFDLAHYLRNIPGFTRIADYDTIASRGSLARVSGTALHAIELGVVASMLLPLAVYLALHDLTRGRVQRWLPVLLIGACIPLSVSRSAILAIVCSAGVFVMLLPARQRIYGLFAIPIAVVGVFATVPGLISTLKSFIFAGSSDSSITHRTGTYPLVEQFVRQAPWFGRGGGTYLPTTHWEILDNQYLKSTIELGVIGVVILAVMYLLVPVGAALSARRQSTDPALRMLAAALAGAALAAAVTSVGFDSLTYPMFGGVLSLVLGLIGAVWLIARHDAEDPAAHASESQREL